MIDDNIMVKTQSSSFAGLRLEYAIPAMHVISYNNLNVAFGRVARFIYHKMV